MKGEGATTPNNSKGWIRFALSIFERAGPIAAVIVAVAAWFVITGQQRELARVHEVSREFYLKLEACYQAHLTLARQCPPGREER